MTASHDVEKRIDSLLAQLTLEEKVALLAGIGGFDFPGVERLGIPRLGTADSPFGVRAGDPATLYVSGIALAATWNPGLARRVGTQIGRDARARGKHYSLGPGVNIYRSPRNGRNFEYFGEDPFLAARMTVPFVEGLQSQGVSATVKHYLGNNSEYGRNVTDSRIDARALREIYLPAFEAAVQEARTGAVMAAYNLVNGEHMTANAPLGVDLLKREWGFDGVLMSDWGAVHDAYGAANGGTDIEMPGPQHFTPDALLALVREGRLSVDALDDKVRRLLRNVERFGWRERPGADLEIPRYNVQGRQAALDGAREAMVMLKNEGALLPLDATRVRRIAVIGPNAHPAVPLGGGSATVLPFRTVSFVEGLAERLGEGVVVQHVRGIPSIDRVVATTTFTTAASGGEPGLIAERFADVGMHGAPTETWIDRVVRVGEPLDLSQYAPGADFDFALLGAPPSRVVTRWTGWYTPETAGRHDVVVQQAGFVEAGFRLFVDDALVADRWSRMEAVLEGFSVTLDERPHRVVLEHHAQRGLGGPFLRLGVVRQGAWVDPAAIVLASRADVVVLAVGFDPASEAEAWDRTFELPPGQDELIERVLYANARAVVVVTSGGGVDMRRWIDRVPAVLQSWYPGQEGGVALAEILLGDVNPSGRLPATFERSLEDNPTHASYYPTSGTNRVEYREGVFVGYRGYERAGTEPLFPFGHGLSYTSFELAGLEIAAVPRAEGIAARWTVSFDVRNTGRRAGAAVAQVYVGDREARVERPAKELKGFAKVMLAPGETRRVEVTLDARALAFFDVESNAWRAEAGEFEILVGHSSADIALRGVLHLDDDVVIPLTGAR